MSILKELQSEIARVARKEIKKELEPVKRVNAQQRKLIANLRRDITDLQREAKRLQRELGKPVPEGEKEEPSQKSWITGKGVLSLRKRLGITQVELSRLACVTQQTVVRWEKTEGKISFRGEAIQTRLQALRSMGKREAMKQLEKEAEEDQPIQAIP